MFHFAQKYKRNFFKKEQFVSPEYDDTQTKKYLKIYKKFIRKMDVNNIVTLQIHNDLYNRQELRK